MNRASFPVFVMSRTAVFEALADTPVSAYGLNFNFHRKTGAGNVGARLAQIVDATSPASSKRVRESDRLKSAIRFQSGGGL